MSRDGERANKTIGRLVRLHRLELGLSQEKLASLCDLDRTYISAIERGARNVSMETVARIAKSLNFTVGAFLAEVAAALSAKPPE